MRNSIALYIIILITGIIFRSCKTLNISKVEERSTVSTTNIIKDRIKNLNYPDNLLLKNASLKIKDENQTSLRLTIYLKKNELIFINGRYMGFEVFRLMVDNDSVKFINRFQRTYYFDNAGKFLNKYGIATDLTELQTFIYSGFLFKEKLNTNYIRSNFSRDEDIINYDYTIDTGRKLNLHYNLNGSLKNLLFSDHPNSIFVNMQMERNDKKLESINGDFINDGNKIDWTLTINQLDYTNYDNLNFRIGKNYYEIQNIF